ncbi:MAG: cytochrome c5 family protein [Tatlockia sp.]|nr:cytochrome c5 family protein [Tatlockia sp.]
MRLALFILFFILSLSIWAFSPQDRQNIEKRIKPIGQVRLTKQELLTTKNTSTLPETAGKATFEQYCSVCHQEGIAGAPKFRNAEDWKPRLAKSTIDELVIIANKGLKAMPMKGTCMNCTDEDLKNAIQFMLPKP